jgi:hypothetical protein
MSYSLPLDLPDTEQFAGEDDKELAGLEIAAALYVSALAVLKAPTPTETGIAEVLDFFGPLGAARTFFHAVYFLETGRLSSDTDEEFEIIAARVRKQCRDMIATGRVKTAGQARQRHSKPAAAGQGDLFGEVL